MSSDDIAETPSPKKKHFYWIDWVRFVAALMVVVCHSRGYNWVAWGNLNPKDQSTASEVFLAVTRPAVEWVVVFFVLSGFLIGGRLIEQSLKKTFDPWSFAIDRLIRIWLPLIPALVLTAIIEYYCGVPIRWVEMLGNVAGLQGVICDNFANNVPLWSLSYEIWFYVLGGCVALIVAKPGKSFLPFIGTAVCFVIFTRLSATLLNCWLLGAVSSFLIARQKGIVSGSLGLFLVLLGVASCQFQASSVSIEERSLHFLKWLPPTNMALLILSCGLGLVIADICLRQPHSVLTIQVERLGTHLAAFSYTMYLTHYPLLNLWNHFIPERSLRFDVASCLIFVSKLLSCLLAGWLIYLPFEAQTSKVKSWFRRQSMSCFEKREG